MLLLFMWIVVGISQDVQIAPQSIDTNIIFELCITLTNIPIDRMSGIIYYFITLNEDFDLSQSSCQYSDNLSCQLFSDYQYLFSRTLDEQTSISMYLNDIVSPIQNKSTTIFITGTDYDQYEYSASVRLYFQPKRISDYQISYTQLNSMGDLTINIISDLLDQIQQLRVILPPYNPEVPNLVEQFYISSNPSCIDMITQTSIPCSKPYDAYLDIVVQPGDVSVRIENFLAPTSTRPVPIDIYLITAGNFYIVKWIGQFVQLTQVPPFSLTIQSSTLTCNAQNELSISIQVPGGVFPSCLISLMIPFSYQTIQVSRENGTAFQISIYQNQILVVYDEYFYASDVLSMVINGITNPSVEGTSQSLQIKIMDTTNRYTYYQILSGITQDFTYLQSQSITQFTIQMVNSTITANTIIRMQFTAVSQQSYSILTQIRVTFPSVISIQDLSLRKCPYTTQGFENIAQCYVSGNVLVVQQGLSQSSLGLQISINALLPSNVQPTADFQLRIMNSDNIINRLATGFTLTASASLITNIQLNSVAQTTCQLTSHVLSFSVGQVQSGSMAFINLPEFYRSQLSNVGECSLFQRMTRQSCSISNELISVRMNYGGDIKIRISGLRSYRSIEVREEIIDIKIYDNTNILYANSDNQNLIQLIEPQPSKSIIYIYSLQGSFYDYNLQLSNYFAGALADYTFNLQFDKQILPTDQLRITFPFSVPPGTLCNPSCSISDEVLTFAISGFDSETQFIGTIQMINTVSLPTPFIYQLCTYDGFIVAHLRDAVGLITPLIDTDFVFEYSLLSTMVNTQTTLRLVWEQIAPLPALSQIILSFRSEGTIYISQLRWSTNLGSIIFCDEPQPIDNTYFVVQVTNGFQIPSGTYQIEFFGLQIETSGTIMQPTSLSIQIVSSNLITIQQQTKSLDIQFACSENCLTCSHTYNYCESCSQLLYRGRCLSECPPITTVQSLDGLQCLQCNTPNMCLECDAMNTQLCKQCDTGYTLIDGYCITNRNNTTQQPAPTTDPVPTDPAPTDPAITDTVPAPSPTEPTPTEPTPTPTPTEPIPAPTPTPTEPTPTEPTPTEPTPTEPTPTEPTPTPTPTPTEPTPTDPAPTDQAITDPAPIDTTPTDPAPLPTGNQPTPVDPAPTTEPITIPIPTSVDLAPTPKPVDTGQTNFEPTPVYQAPTDPATTQPVPINETKTFYQEPITVDPADVSKIIEIYEIDQNVIQNNQTDLSERIHQEELLRGIIEKFKINVEFFVDKVPYFNFYFLGTVILSIIIKLFASKNTIFVVLVYILSSTFELPFLIIRVIRLSIFYGVNYTLIGAAPIITILMLQVQASNDLSNIMRTSPFINKFNRNYKYYGKILKNGSIYYQWKWILITLCLENREKQMHNSIRQLIQKSIINQMFQIFVLGVIILNYYNFEVAFFLYDDLAYQVIMNLLGILHYGWLGLRMSSKIVPMEQNQTQQQTKNQISNNCAISSNEDIVYSRIKLQSSSISEKSL